MARNRLGRESSPYLLQHADNPVDWYPWGPEALRAARERNVPIFLSVGYSACHWCHVMEHESFENEGVAEVMNRHFVSVKVDREERPDIDAIYQEACQRVTGQGGWPLSVFLTPDQKPFYVGTYFPVLDGYGRPGFGSILRQLAQAWEEKPQDVRRQAEKFVENMNMRGPAADPVRVGRPPLDEAAVNLLQAGDPAYGGFGTAPKFPNAACISFLFRYARLSGVSRFSEFATRSLRKMAEGGIFDQVGGGFHRYSTDRRWLVPHFEKMLYDNALVPINYAEAYQISGDPFHLDIMERTLGFVLRDMTSPDGAFYSALDADSEGEEGRYYVWTKREIRDILGDDADIFCTYYGVTDGGNWEGNSILHRGLRLSAAAFACSVPDGEARRTIRRCEGILLAARRRRVPPGLDDKVLASWNGMMVSALARGHRVTGNAEYLDAARRALAFITRNMLKGDTLYRAHKGGARISGFLEDYAYVASALLDVFEEHPDAEYLEAARRLGARILERFWDGSEFYMTPDDHESLIMRPPSGYDLAVPSGGSVAVTALGRLHALTGNAEFGEAADAALKSKMQRAAENPMAFGQLLNAAYARVRGSSEVTVMCGGDPAVPRALGRRFLPEGIVVFVRNAHQAEALQRYPFFEGKRFGDATEAYVCRNMACSPPLDNMADVDAAL